MDWYYMLDGERRGPCSEEDIKILLTHCKLSKESLVWNSDMGKKWSKISDIPELSGHSALKLAEKTAPPAPQPKAADPTELATLDDRTVARANLLLENMLEERARAQYMIDELVHQKVPEGAARQMVLDAIASRNRHYRKEGLKSVLWAIGSIVFLCTCSLVFYLVTGHFYLLKRLPLFALFLGCVVFLSGVGRLIFGARTRLAWILPALGIVGLALAFLKFNGTI